MKVINFSRSFLTFRIDMTRRPPTTVTHEPSFTLNNARVLIDCQCVIREKKTDVVETFVMGASCKTEHVNVERDIWTQPNADFVPVLSGTQFMQIKTYDHIGRKVELHPPSRGVQPERHVAAVADAFDDVRIDVGYCTGELLGTVDEVIESTLRNDPLVARTEFENDRYHAVIEYPIKTMNVSPRDRFYQTDTGPVLLPDLSRNREDLIGGMEMAFSAFSTDAWAEFIVRCAGPITNDVTVYHYSRAIRMDNLRNKVFRLEID